MKFLKQFALIGTVLAFSGAAIAADIARLEWGSFIVESDSSNGWSEYKSVSSDDGRSLRMTFSPFEAKADGTTFEANARLAGRYDLMQPAYDNFTGSVATIEGHVIKSAAASVRLVVKVGPTTEIIEWMTGKEVSEKFSRKINVDVPQGGRLPNPFPVSIEAYVKKEGATDAAYVSVDSLTIGAVNASVALN